jgi:phosphohistidine phosphatase
LTTAKYFKEAMEIPDADFETNHTLYDFRGANTIRFIKSLDDDLDRVMIVGHNHAFTSIVNMMGDKYIENLPTCGFAMIEFDVDHWADIVTGKTVLTIFPRDLKL